MGATVPRKCVLPVWYDQSRTSHAPWPDPVQEDAELQLP